MGQNKTLGRPYCYRCQHYYVTWDKRFPNGCRAYGIKSKHFPASEVLRVTGHGCLCYQPKQGADLSDPGSKARGGSGDRYV